MLRLGSFVVALSLAACGGGSGGGGTPGGGSAQAAIMFPTPVALTDAATIAVRGTATSSAGISAVSVNGVAAASTDGFANWTATVPLSFGLNDLVVSATDSAGGVNANAASARVVRDDDATMTGTMGAGEAYDSFQDAFLDRAGNRLLVTESGAFLAPGDSRLFAVELNTGNRIVLSSDATIGGGTPAVLDAAHGLGVDLAGGNIFITDRELNQVIRVDPVTGARSVVSDAAVGPAPTFDSSEDVEYIPSLNLLCWIDNSTTPPRILATTLGSSGRVIMSDDSNTGPTMDNIDMLRYDATNNRLLVSMDDVTGAILAVDLANGNRTELASPTTGTGGPAGFRGPSGIGLDPTRNRIVTHLRNDAVTVFVDLATGNRTVISEAGVRGNGPAVAGSQSTEYDAVNQVAYVLDTTQEAIFVIDGVTGERAIFSR